MSDGAKKFEERQEDLQCVKDLTPMEKFMGETYSDPVSHPSHYNKYPVETKLMIKAVMDIMPPMDSYSAGLLYNELKYRFRLGHKDASDQEIGKAMWYYNERTKDE